MNTIDELDIDHSKRREEAERQASALATDPGAKLAHKELSILHGDRVVAARKAINKLSGLRQ